MNKKEQKLEDVWNNIKWTEEQKIILEGTLYIKKQVTQTKKLTIKNPRAWLLNNIIHVIYDLYLTILNKQKKLEDDWNNM
jgi:hypothetical protein